MLTIRGLFRVTLIFFSVSLLACSSKTTMTHDEVEEFYKNLEQAINQKNVDSVTDMLSDDVRIAGKVYSGDETKEINFNKQEYANQIRESLSQLEKYSYKINDIDIEISPDGTKANVKLKIVESMTVQGNNITASTKEQDTLVIQGGKILATDINAVTFMR